jgi:hypothetical protein
VNVCRAARALGLRATLVAFTPGHTGGAAAALLADERIDAFAAALASRLAAGGRACSRGLLGSASVESPVAGGLDVARAGALATRIAGAAAP